MCWIAGHCLVQHLVGWRSSIERSMRSLMVIVMYELFNSLRALT